MQPRLYLCRGVPYFRESQCFRPAGKPGQAMGDGEGRFVRRPKRYAADSDSSKLTVRPVMERQLSGRRRGCQYMLGRCDPRTQTVWKKGANKQADERRKQSHLRRGLMLFREPTRRSRGRLVIS
jgi:hypothetical protein